jgi:PAS domain S-box-containing protein
MAIDVITVLYVDDSPFDRDLVFHALQKEHGGFNVIEADSREEFENKLAMGGYDIVLSDFNILGFEGLQVLDMVHAIIPGLPVIIVTGTGNEEVAVEALKKGADDYVVKSPSHIRRLPQTIYSVIDTKRSKIERMQVQRELQESEARWQSLVANAPNFITIVDSSHVIEFINHPVQGLTLGDVIGNSIYEFITPEYHDLPRRFIAEAFRTGESGSYISTATGNQNNIAWYENSLAPIKNADGSVVSVAIIASDITERKQAEMRLTEMMEDLQRSNKELERFAYVVSHDLQEPLRMVASYVQLLEKRYKDQLDQDANDFINFAADGAIRMQRMILDILEYSRVGTRGQAFEQTDLNLVLTKAMANVGGQIEDSGALITNDELPQVLADEIQMVQLLQNLIGNAIKFRSEDTPLIHISSLEDEAEWTISVKDNGIGIHREHQDKIFAVSRRLHPIGKYTGSGIGLAIAARIVDRHGGRIWLESDPGKGSVFYLTIPKKQGMSDA